MKQQYFIRTLACLLAGLMLFTAISCGKADNDNEATGTTTAANSDISSAFPAAKNVPAADGGVWKLWFPPLPCSKNTGNLPVKISLLKNSLQNSAAICRKRKKSLHRQ